MKCSEIIEGLEQLAPLFCACDWDNVGLLAGRREKEVSTVYLALDATDGVIEDACRTGADLLLTHHPLIFKPMPKINDDDFIGKRILTLIQNDISYYAMHTNFDGAPGCMADLAAKRLGLADTGILEPLGETEGVTFGIGKSGYLEQPVPIAEFAATVKQAFGLPHVMVYGDTKSRDLIRCVAVSPGSGKSMIGHARMAGAQVLVTGDIGHHEGIDAVAQGLMVIDAGHYGLEHIFMDFMEGYITERWGGQVNVVKAKLAFPAVVC